MSFILTNGTFDVLSYDVSTNDIANKSGSKEYSCSIKVKFCPNAKIQMENDDRICLVQAVCDKIELQQLDGRSITANVVKKTLNRDKNKTADFSNRLAEGWAIDQQLYNESGTLCNLDPRYVEQRLVTSLYRDHSDFSKKDLIGYVQNYVHNVACLDSAILSDKPNAIYNWGSKTIPVGSQEFEIVAMLDKVDGTKKYIGSLHWGWEITKDKFDRDVYAPKLSKKDIVVNDNPTPFFIGAAKKWNEMLNKKLKNMIEAFILPVG